MNNRLNFPHIEQAMESLGLNKAELARRVGVSRTIVTSWFQENKFPRPDKLLKLGLALRLPFENLVIKESLEPVVAFRKKGPQKTKEKHIIRAKEMGRLIDALVPYLPAHLTEEPVLKKPIVEYRYIQDVASSVRRRIKVQEGHEVRFETLIQIFHDFEVMIIPVLWGSKENHENALHIFLPQSKTTWTYLNLDSNLHDFKFWMAHELGHILTPSLSNLEEGEDFADMFAQALLFPEVTARTAYKKCNSLATAPLRIKHVFGLAEKLLISPITIKIAIDEYARQNDFRPINFGTSFFAATCNFNKRFQNVSQTLIDNKDYTVSKYIEVAEDAFGSSFFKVLKAYLRENDSSPGFIQGVLQTTLLDAKEIYAELVN